MFGLDNNGDAVRMESLHERVGNLRGELFLNLQPAREDVDDARHFRKADHFAVGNISDVCFANEWQQMMLAHRVKLDVFYQNDLARVRSENCLVNDGIEILAITVR